MMMGRVLKSILCALLVLVLAPGPEAWAAKRKAARKTAKPTARAAVLIDASSKKVIYGKNAQKRVFPASTTKVMTALLVLEKLSLDDYVTVSENATGVQPTKINVKAGERYRVRDLLYAILLKSANDASIVLAEAVAGSHWKFVEMMNERARKLGAVHTRFANAHGLPSKAKQYTTAMDMALIFREALKKEFFRKAITFKYRVIYSQDGRRHFLKSHNKSMFLGWKQNVYGKTGYTREAQSCFVGHYAKGSGSRIIAVFGCTKRWEDIKFIVERHGKLDL